MTCFLYLSIAIVSEVMATTLLPFTQGFTKFTATVFCLLGYAGAFYFLSLATKAGMSTSVAYAIWCGLGIVLVMGVAAVMGNIPNYKAIAGAVLIICGVITISLSGQGLH